MHTSPVPSSRRASFMDSPAGKWVLFGIGSFLFGLIGVSLLFGDSPTGCGFGVLCLLIAGIFGLVNFGPLARSSRRVALPGLFRSPERMIMAVVGVLGLSLVILIVVVIGSLS